MRNGQNKHRMRGRNRGGGKNHNPLTRVYESNGPDVKIRGTANHVAEKYIQLARDATASGDPVAAENYYQHAEHYFRLIAAAQEQFRQSQPFQQRPEGGNAEESFDESDDSQPGYGMEPHSPQPQYQQRDNNQPYQQREQPYQQQRDFQPRQDRQDRQERQDNRRDNRNENRQYDSQPQGNGAPDEEMGLPSFITGTPAQAAGQQNGHENQGDRFPMHRRRRRGHRGPRPEGGDGGDEAQPSGE
jgi:hypothetical protein